MTNHDDAQQEWARPWVNLTPVTDDDDREVYINPAFAKPVKDGASTSAALPTDSQARKAIPLARGLLDYFPDALAEVARLSLVSNEKHNPGQPMHWSREKSNDHADTILRHMVDRGKVDDDGFLHDVKVAWRALAQLQLALEARKG